MIVSSSLAHLSPRQLVDLIDGVEQQLERSTNEEDAEVVEKTVMAMPSVADLFRTAGWYAADAAAAKLFWQEHATSLEELGLAPGSSYVIVNGRVSCSPLSNYAELAKQ